VATEVLVDHIWGEEPPASATKAVHKYVSEIRRTLGIGVDGALSTEGPGYVLRLPPGAVDARRFEALVTAGRRLADAEAIQALEEAESLWRGAALDEFADLEWARPSAQRLDEQRLAAAERRLGLLVTVGRPADALPELDTLVLEHPLREELCAQLMLACGHTGRRGDALAAYQRLRRSLADELGIEPSSRLRELEQQILEGDLAGGHVTGTTGGEPQSAHRSMPTASIRQRGRLPIPVSVFIGRSDLLERVGAALVDSRLVTLTGPGGSGKTRVAVEVARSAEERFDSATLFVDLSVVDAPEFVVRAVADADGLPDQPGIDVSVLVQESLSSRPTLLVIDNCEHLLTAVAELAATLLSTCPKLTVLATSREPMGIAGEQVRPVPPLQVPDEAMPISDADRCEAVQLFSTRACEADPSFEIDDDNRTAVADICRRLDGIPLALELAAAQVPVMSPGDIAHRLVDRFRLLTSPAGRPVRQATLRAAIDWSHDLLTPDEKRLFECLSVFPGRFDVSAATAVSEMAEAEVVVLLAGLVRRSMVDRSGDVAGVSRYRLLDTLRAYGREHLAERDDDVTYRSRHARHYAALTRHACEAQPGRDDLWHLAITADHDNVRAALRYAVDHDRELASRMAFALSRYWRRTDQVVDGLTYVERLIATPDLGAQCRAAVECCAAELRTEHGEATRAEPEAASALTAFEELGDIEGVARAKFALGRSLANGGRYERAIALMDEAGRSFATFDDAYWASTNLTIGDARLALGDYEDAARGYTMILGWAVRHQMDFFAAKAQWLLGVAARHTGALTEARERCERALEAFADLDDRSATAHVRMTLGDIARLADDRAAAATLYSDAFDALSDIGDRRCTASAMKNLADLERHSDPGRSASLYVQCLDRRQTLGDQSGVAEALEGLAAALADVDRMRIGATLLGRADAIRSETGALAPEIERRAVDGTRDRLAGAMSPDELGDAVAAGAAMTLDEAVDAAHAVLIEGLSRSTSPH